MPNRLARDVSAPALLGLFLLLGLAYSLVTPLFEAPDEIWHYAYVRYLAEGHGLPALTDNRSGANQEVAQPPLYYGAAAALNTLVRDDDLSAVMWHNPGFGYQSPGTSNDNKNMLVHTRREAFPWHGTALAVRVARFVSLAFGLATVAAAWGVGREAFPDRPLWALSVAAVVAFTPQFLFISGVASNDSAAAACATAALWSMARIVTQGVSPRRALLTGLLIGMSILTKTSALLLGLLAIAAFWMAGRTAWRRTALLLVAAGSVALLVGGWWYARNALLYQDPLALRIHVDSLWGRSTPASLAMLLAELPTVYRTFWGGFGWGHVTFPDWVYWALAGALAASAVGWARMALQRRLPGRGQVFALAALWWGLVFVALLQWMRQVEAPHGRLLFPAIAAGALWLVGGWAALPWRWLRFGWLTGLAVLSLATPWTVIRPAFAPPRLVTPAQAQATVDQIGWEVGGVARLLGVTLESASVAPGETLEVRACWEGLAPMAQEYTVFLHLVGRDDRRVAERYTYPGLGRFPTSLWPVGAAFCDAYPVPVDDWAPVPELYDLLIGLYHAPSGERLAVRDAAGADVAFPVVAQVRVAPEQPLSIVPEQPRAYRLGDQIALLGYDLAGEVRSGATFTVTLYWRAEARPADDYTVFVHLTDAAGAIVAQHDGVPRTGRYPTRAWQVGDVVPDAHVLELPTLPAGEPLHLSVGMYLPATVARLPVLTFDGRPIGDAVPLLSASP
ncbi:MAG: DUF2142 domain-containing protein [Anaerolineae bacterium]|nr:DUF2142 domain-containing protein [Anaerolineae bacterium]